MIRRLKLFLRLAGPEYPYSTWDAWRLSGFVRRLALDYAKIRTAR
jgi:hypothetical protein